MPERVAGWLDAVGAFARRRKSIFWIGGGLGSAALIALSILGAQALSYRSLIRKQAELLARVYALESGLDGFSVNGEEQSPQRAKVVRELLGEERRLFRIRGKLKPPDRAHTYRLPVGADVHGVLEELGKNRFIVPESFIKSVQGEIEYFTKPGNRATLERCFRRKPRFEALIREELARRKLPPDFLYIAMQESQFDPAAQSGNEARGLWQMVPETAKEHGLKVPDEWKSMPPEADERTLPRASTRAAANYLHALYSEFGDAALAMAAYNAGAGRMRKTLRRIEDPVNDRDYWYVYRMGMMPPETREYVPKIIAMILIDRNRAKYGFKG